MIIELSYVGMLEHLLLQWKQRALVPIVFEMSSLFYVTASTFYKATRRAAKSLR